MTARHTPSYLMQRLAAAATHPKKRFGQNFLVDLNLLERIAATAQLDRRDVVLEVGTGAGSLTMELARAAGAVVTVEIDTTLQRLAGEELAEFDNVSLLGVDAMAGKHGIQAEVLAAVSAKLSEVPESCFKLVANLPYNIATPLMANLLLLDRPPDRMVVTIQLELAERLAALPGTKDYGALSVWIQSQADVRIVRKLPPHVFWPRPQVDSAIVDVQLDRERRTALGDLTALNAFIHRLFLHRRKKLASQVADAAGVAMDGEAVRGLLTELGIDPDCRAEDVPVDRLVALARRVLP